MSVFFKVCAVVVDSMLILVHTCLLVALGQVDEENILSWDTVVEWTA